MVSLNELKKALVRDVTTEMSSPNQQLSDSQYNIGFDILMNGSEWSSYEDFIIPELSQQLTSLLATRSTISVIEIGPGSKSVLGYVPLHLRRKIRRYAAFEPNIISATSLEAWISSCSESNSPFPYLETTPNICRAPFVLDDEEKNNIVETGASDDRPTFDLILFCHSMYGMKSKEIFIKKALEMLVSSPESGKVVIFHRDQCFELDGLTSYRTAIFPTGTVSIADKDVALDAFSPFVAGFIKQDVEVDMALRTKWRETCRALACHDEKLPGYLLFSSPQRMLSLTRHANALVDLVLQVPLAKEDRIIKSWEARLHRPTSIFRPTTVKHVQKCIQWAVKHKLKLTVIGGGHSAHCLWPDVVSLDMEAFDRVHVTTSSDDVDNANSRPGSTSLIIAEAGCKTGDIIQEAMKFGLTVPLGSRPSVGAGLWLQGGIGHLSRLHGLACDNIVGAVIVSVISGQIFHVGEVPIQDLPAGATRPKNEKDLLWAIKGAGTNFGVVISVTFKAYCAPTYSVWNWIFPVKEETEVRLKLGDVNSIARNLPLSFSIDAYLYSDRNQLHLGVTMFQASTNKNFEMPPLVNDILGPVKQCKEVDGVGLFETEMYMSTMHGGHSGKSSSFKRCLFLNNIEDVQIVDILRAAIQNRPTPFCYLHLLQCGGATRDNTTEASAFGCRDWEFACVITGVWPRNQIDTGLVRTTIQWVYDIVKNLLPFCSGVYSADLGPDPRDNTLAAKAFGVNLQRLAQLKRTMDPYKIIAYACPLFEPPVEQKLIILVTGDSAAGKDFCAETWVSVITACTSRMLTARSVSISDATKREYATETGADINRLLSDRSYKEEHRPALTKFYQKQMINRPQLPMEHFQNVVRDSGSFDVIFITGMRDEAPLTTFSHLVPESRVLDIRINASQMVIRDRKCDHRDGIKAKDDRDGTTLSALHYLPSLVFNNEISGSEAAETFAKKHILPLLHEDFTRLANMVRAVPNHPRQGVTFRHVLDICQQPGGLTLCTDLLQRHFIGEWAEVDTLVCCECGGFVFASALGARTGIRLALVRKSGKLPPPTISVEKSQSHISSTESGELQQNMFEMDPGLISKSKSVLVVDDVLATGRTLGAVLKLLMKAGVRRKDIRVMVVAEFPIHSGRESLRQEGFGEVRIQSLLTFGGV
ncbi:putative phosphoribosyl transferase domain protein [Botrytis fragariae]|uniref:Putative phosphoribosyl transferase domain protein n=1 Tax=Botrytis fragariae TaxID=1964551 RepID=A0A8H6ENW2_9HELO|nr:putative phosphoribosyl transferase domain protein [Botrytis fragariae]KAF5879108.1 putative phosphoribosyl transferase domain protein [Botrytis fragariae]